MSDKVYNILSVLMIVAVLGFGMYSINKSDSEIAELDAVLAKLNKSQGYILAQMEFFCEKHNKQSEESCIKNAKEVKELTKFIIDEVNKK